VLVSWDERWQTRLGERGHCWLAYYNLHYHGWTIDFWVGWGMKQGTRMTQSVALLARRVIRKTRDNRPVWHDLRLESSTTGMCAHGMDWKPQHWKTIPNQKRSIPTILKREKGVHLSSSCDPNMASFFLTKQSDPNNLTKPASTQLGNSCKTRPVQY